MITKALIYCRVSSERQVLEGHGNSSQEQRCRSWALGKSYAVEKVFRDDGVSGALFDRPAMKELIAYLDAHPNEQYSIIFDDVSRFARDVKVHLLLRSELVSRGAKLECPNFNFEDSPEGEFAENITAASAQYDRQKNRRQVLQKQKARIEGGYWAFCPPKGLKFVKDPVHGKLLTPDEPWATVLKCAIEGHAAGQFITLEEVQTFINSEGQRLGNGYKTSIDGVHRFLTEILYTGYVEYAPWGVARRQGHHNGFISLETYNKVQDILTGRSRPKARKDYNQDFPLRGLVACDACRRAFTGSWNKGRSKYYASYFCHNKGCPMRNKTVAKDKLEGDFATLLKQVTLPKELTSLTKEVLLDTWEQKTNDLKVVVSEAERQIVDIDVQIANLAARSAKTDKGEVVAAYERQIETLTLEKAVWLEKQDSKLPSDADFGTALDMVLSTLANPVSMWESDRYQDKRTITYMYFDGKLSYQKGVGFGTTNLEPNIALIREFGSSRTSLVDIAGQSWNQIQDYIFKWYAVLKNSIQIQNLALSLTNS